MPDAQLVAARFEPNDRALLVKVCQDRRETISDFVRKACMTELGRLGYLTNSERKALGVK